MATSPLLSKSVISKMHLDHPRRNHELPPSKLFHYFKTITPNSSQKIFSLMCLSEHKANSSLLVQLRSLKPYSMQYGGFKHEKDFEFSQEDGVSELTVKGGSTEIIEIHTPEEVNYKEEFVPTDEGSYIIIVQKAKKSLNIEPIHNTFKPSKPGKVILTIENVSSKKKRVYIGTRQTSVPHSKRPKSFMGMWDELSIYRPRTIDLKEMSKRIEQYKVMTLLATLRPKLEGIQSKILNSTDLPSFAGICKMIRAAALQARGWSLVITKPIHFQVMNSKFVNAMSVFDEMPNRNLSSYGDVAQMVDCSLRMRE
ncbi:hypothetical protein RJ641_017642, partial [Dillenia turbinata]